MIFLKGQNLKDRSLQKEKFQITAQQGKKYIIIIIFVRGEGGCNLTLREDRDFWVGHADRHHR